MKRSESIKEIASALAKAQLEKDRFAEAILIPKIANLMRPRPKNYKPRSIFDRFSTQIVFGFSDCWYWRGLLSKDGYGKFGSKLAHRVSWELTYGQISFGKHVLHKCDVRNCVNYEHLYLGDQFDNMRDMMVRGRRKYAISGESNPNAKLTQEIINTIRTAGDDISKKSLAKKYGIGMTQIYRILRKESWR